MGLLLPTAPGFVGTIQIAFAASLLPFGFDKEEILAGAIVYNFLITLPPLFLTGLVWLMVGKKWITLEGSEPGSNQN